MNKKVLTGNTIPAPLAWELEGDEAERAWNAAVSGGALEDRTVPAHLMGPDSERPENLPAVTLDAALAEARRRNRASPSPRAWAQLYRILIRHAVQLGLEPPAPPVAPQEWVDTPAMSKRALLRSQLEWAQVNGCLEPAYAFIAQLPEPEWHAIGE